MTATIVRWRPSLVEWGPSTNEWVILLPSSAHFVGLQRMGLVGPTRWVRGQSDNAIVRWSNFLLTIILDMRRYRTIVAPQSAVRWSMRGCAGNRLLRGRSSRPRRARGAWSRGARSRRGGAARRGCPAPSPCRCLGRVAGLRRRLLGSIVRRAA